MDGELGLTFSCASSTHGKGVAMCLLPFILIIVVIVFIVRLW